MEKLKYNFYKALAKGGFAMFLSLTAAFLLCFFTIVLIRYILISILPETEDVFHDFGMHMWVTFLAMTDPGNMNQDNLSHQPFKVTAILAGLLGVIIFSTLIAFITTILENNFQKLRKNRNKVLEVGHTLILGWNDKVIDIIAELIYANESLPYASVVILSLDDKDTIEDTIVKNLPETKTTSIYITTGDCGSLTELKRVNAAQAKSVIILANCFDSDPIEMKELSDIHAIKTILALNSCQGQDSKIPIIVELFNSSKSELIDYFNNDRILYVHNWKIMGKLLMQTSLTSGLVRVYDEMLSFTGNEIYILPYNGKSMCFGELAYYYKEGIPLGIKDANGKILLPPSPDLVITNEDFIIILAQDDSTVKQQSHKINVNKSLKFRPNSRQKVLKSILILGWHEIAFHYVKESKGHLPAGSSIHIVYKEPSDVIISKIQELQDYLPEIKIELINKDAFLFTELEKLKPFDYDNVILLPQNVLESSTEKNDTISLVILMMLKKIKNNLLPLNPNTSVIVQVLDSNNQDLIVQTDIDDFITSNKLTTKILAQLSENPNLIKLYDELFSDQGYEIYVKPIDLYTDTFPINNEAFIEIMELAKQRNEICLGICKSEYLHDANNNFGFTLNIPKTSKISLNENDFLIVLAENEL